MGWHLARSAVSPLFFPTVCKNLLMCPHIKSHDNFLKQGVLSVNHVNDDMVEVNGFNHRILPGSSFYKTISVQNCLAP